MITLFISAIIYAVYFICIVPLILMYELLMLAVKAVVLIILSIIVRKK